MDRSWMYDRLNPNRRGLKSKFVSGVQEFIKKAKEQPHFLSEGGIWCPCAKCKCMKLLTSSEVKVHLHKAGFKPNYWIWTEHGEVEPNIDRRGQSNNGGHMEKEVQDEHEPPQDMDSYERNTDGKVIIRPHGRGWAPCSAAINAIKHAIQIHFYGPFHCWSETPYYVREYWWKLFGDKVAWDPRDYEYIKTMFVSRGAKCLSDMLAEVRKKGMRPHWIREEAWRGLIAHWEGQTSKKISTQNHDNQASGRGGAVHTVGCNVALSMEEEEGVEESPQDMDSYERNTDGKVIIRPHGRGWAPSSAAINAIKHAIQIHFYGPFHCWIETPFYVREYWWKLFGDKVSWDPRDYEYIKTMFESRGAKCLSDMLAEVRKKGMRPHWIREEAWRGLIGHWEGQTSKKILTQNHNNQASGRGGAVHTVGCNVALSMEEEEEEEEEESPQDMDSFERNTDGKVIIRPHGRGWAPCSAAINAIKHAIQIHFYGPFHCWSETPYYVREYWWKLFGDKVAWDPRDYEYIKTMFVSRGAKCLSDMLAEVRKKGMRPHWIREEAWRGLIAHWEGQTSKKIWSQNITNQASGRGGAVHIVGCNVALSMEEEEGVEESPQDMDSYERNTDGKVIIRPHGRGWAPSSAAINAIKHAIQIHFYGPFHCWSETPYYVREYWWKLFADKAAWDPRDYEYIKKTFESRGAKCLSDMLAEVRKKGMRPHWIREEAWRGLIAYWEGQTSKKISTQNNTNQASSRGAVHTLGFNVPLSMEEEEEEPPQDMDSYERNTDGKVIIRPYGRGWAPSSAAADAIKHAIQRHFYGPFHCWSETPYYVREYWWKLFGDKVAWDPCYYEYIKKTFELTGPKCLSNMLAKARKKGTRPHWIREEAWKGLITLWEGQASKNLSTQNKTNQVSGRGEAVRTVGCKAHLDVALSIEEEEEEDEDEDEEEEEEDEPPPDMDSQERNADGKVIIRPFGRGWVPSSAAANAIKHAIQTHFYGPFHCWSETPEYVREYWWKLFGDKVSWDPCDYGYIKKTFQSRVAKRLSDMLAKARKKGMRPHWIREEAWKGLIAHWEGQAFKKVSTQNKTNRASVRGGTVHTTGRKAHHDVALSMARKLGRSVDPDELFLETHTKKSGNWVDNRSQTTYTQYCDRLREVQTQIDESSPNGTQEVDGATKLELWKVVAGGKKRGRCYGTADLSSNLRRGATSLTQEFRAPFDTSGRSDHVAHQGANDVSHHEAIDAARQEVAAARQEAVEAKQHCRLLEEQLRTVMERMTALERQSAGAPTSASQAQAHQGHPHYDDNLNDHLLHEVSPDRRRRRRRRL